MVRPFTLWLAVASLFAACGQVANDGSAEQGRGTAGSARIEPEQPIETANEEGRESLGGSGSLGFFTNDSESASERPDLRDIYAVFARPANPRDAKAVMHARDWFNEPYDPAHDDLGRVVASEARVLLDEIGPDDVALYAVPTDKGYLCIGLSPNGGSSCGAPGPGGFDLGYTYEPTWLLVYGIVDNDVTRVDVRVAGELHSARMGENGFAFFIEGIHNPKALFAAVVLHRRNGPSDTFELP